MIIYGKQSINYLIEHYHNKIQILYLSQELDKKDKEKLLKLAKELYKQKKYKKLRKEIEERRKEIEKGEILSHEEIWK